MHAHAIHLNSRFDVNSFGAIFVTVKQLLESILLFFSDHLVWHIRNILTIDLYLGISFFIFNKIIQFPIRWLIDILFDILYSNLQMWILEGQLLRSSGLIDFFFGYNLREVVWYIIPLKRLVFYLLYELDISLSKCSNLFHIDPKEKQIWKIMYVGWVSEKNFFFIK
jgi:hypothetical protein